MPRTVLVTVYAHPEAYPPTLNALQELAATFDEVVVVYRPIMQQSWTYAPNVHLLPSGASMDVREQERLPIHRKVGLFARFVTELRKAIRGKRPELVLVYDALALFAYSIARKSGLPPHKVWYHNHDVLFVPPGRLSLNWFASRAERRIFRNLDFFSLPADERKVHFPVSQLKGQYFFIPNLPSLQNRSLTTTAQAPTGEFRLIFQGHISEGHGFEEIIEMMPFEIGGLPVKLVLVGWIRDEYRHHIATLTQARRAASHVVITGVVPYKELPGHTSNCHAGLAIFNLDNGIYTTAGTASNKIYEYAAAGLPVLYFDNDHYRQHLGQYSWAVPTDLSSASLRNALDRILSHWAPMSRAAVGDFRSTLNYESHFRPVLNRVALASQQ